MNVLEKFKEEVSHVKEKAKEERIVWKETGKIFWNNLKEHPEIVGSALTGLIPIIGGAIMLIGNQKDKAEDECRIHDEMTGFDWVTDHKLTNQEKLEVNGLIDNDCYSLGNALDTCGYLKKEKKRR